MRVKKVNRYWCDHCNKAGLSAFHMRKHERTCTLNPARECRMCKWASGGQATPVAELVALLPDSSALRVRPEGATEEWPWDAERALRDSVKAALPALREAADNCPACIMAALRQAKIPVPVAEDFNFTAECKALFDAHNAAEMANVGACYG